MAGKEGREVTPDEGLILPALVPVANRLLLSPEAESARAAQLRAIDEAEDERRDEDEGYDDPEPSLSERVRQTVCRKCGHRKLCFLPARLCEPCLKKAAASVDIPFPRVSSGGPMNRAQRRAAGQRGKKQ